MRRRFGIEPRQIKFGEVGGDMAEASARVPIPKIAPIIRRETFLRDLGPSDVMPPIVGGQVDAVHLVVGGYYYTADVHHGVLAKVLFVHRSTSGGAAVNVFMCS